MTTEKKLERKLRKQVKSFGGLALKFVSPGFTGVPDRVVLMPDGNTFFVELKSEGKKPSYRQKFVHRKLNQLGFQVFVIDSEFKLQEFLNHVDRK